MHAEQPPVVHPPHPPLPVPTREFLQAREGTGVTVSAEEHILHSYLSVQLQVEPWGAGAWVPGKGPWTANPLHNKGTGDLSLGQGNGQWEKLQEQQPPGSPVLRLGRDKGPGVPLFRVPPWKHQVKLLFYYLVIASWLNYFQYLGVWEPAEGNVGLNWERNLVWTWCGGVSVGCMAAKGPQYQLRWSDWQSGSWMVWQESFLNTAACKGFALPKLHSLEVGFQLTSSRWSIYRALLVYVQYIVHTNNVLIVKLKQWSLRHCSDESIFTFSGIRDDASWMLTRLSLISG